MSGSVEIVGVWELGWNSPIKELDLWEFPLKDFSVSHINMTPVTGLGVNTQCLKEFHSVEEALSTYPNHQVVFIDEAGETELSDFTHPENAIYVFGKTSYSPFKTHAKPGDMSIRIDTIQKSGLLWSHQAATLILYDRMKKQS